MVDGRHIGKYNFGYISLTPQRFIRFARNFQRHRKIGPQWQPNVKKCWILKIQDGSLQCVTD